MLQTLEIGREVVGYHKMENITSPTPLPGVGSVVLMQAETQGIRYRPDNIDPDTTTGITLQPGEIHILNLGHGKINNIRVLEVTTGAILHVVTFK